MSRWLFFPTQGSALTLDISGTFNSTFGSGAKSTSPTITLPSSGISGLSYVGMRADGSGGNSYGLGFIFDSTTNRNAFVSSYPSDFSQLTYHDTLNDFDMLTASAWSWDTTASTTRAYLREDQWSNWQAVSQTLVGKTFTLQG